MRRFKHIITAILAAIFLVSVPASAFAAGAENPTGETTYNPLPRPGIYSAAGIVMDARTGAVIYEKNIHERRPMASTTKIMTVLLALESCDSEDGGIDRDVAVTVDMMHWEAGTNEIGLEPGHMVSLRDLVIACMMYSANDAAQAIAVELGGSFEGFAELMNKRAAEIGMSDTCFVTPSGLSVPGHYSSAYDMALLGVTAVNTPGFLAYTKMPKAVIAFGSPEKNEFTIYTHNHLLEGQRRGYRGCDGLKTGYTAAAGSCFVSHVEQNGVSLVCVTLGASSTSGYLSDHTALYDYALSRYKRHGVAPLLPADNIPVIGGFLPTAPIKISGPVSEIYVLDSLDDAFNERVFIDSFAYAPVVRGQVVGYVQYLCGDLLLAEVPIQIDAYVDSASSDWVSAYVRLFKRINMEN